MGRPMNTPWYKNWFGDAYKRLYPHRDFQEAEGQVAYVLRELPVTPAWRILDVGCGQGRHLEILRNQNFSFCYGLDLSLPLLKDARAKGLPVMRGDMGHLPLRFTSFDLVTSFFTSFGYFATLEADVEVLAQYVSVLKPGGFLFLDLINKEYLLNNLVPEDKAFIDGAEVRQKRHVEGSIVIKQIEIRSPQGGTEKFEERVRLYGLDEMLALAKRFSLNHLKTFGNEKGEAYHARQSPRMSLLLQKAQ
jgi:SAM-dependent methyltransferase